MILTDLQKDIVRKIELGVIPDVHNFLVHFDLVTEVAPPFGDYYIVLHGHWYIFRDIKLAHKYLEEVLKTSILDTILTK